MLPFWCAVAKRRMAALPAAFAPAAQYMIWECTTAAWATTQSASIESVVRCTRFSSCDSHGVVTLPHLRECRCRHRDVVDRQFARLE